jgi:hypothetical protein
MCQDKSEPAQIVHARLAIDRDVIDFLEPNSCSFQAIIERIGRQPRPNA